MYSSGGWGGARYRAGGLTSQFALASTNGAGGIICDHAAPPQGYHYEQTPGTTGSCNLRLVANSTTGSGSNNGSGTGSNTGTGTGTGTTTTPGGTTTGTGTGATSDGGLSLSPELTKALWIAAAIWVASKVFKG